MSRALLSAAVRKYARTLSESPRRGGAETVRYRWELGTVVSFETGVSVTVVLDETNELTAPYLARYTPTAGDLVRVDFRGNSPLVVDRVVGVTSS